VASWVSTVPCSASGGEQWSAPTGPNTEVSYQKHISRMFLKLKKWTLFDRYYGFSAKYLGQCRLVSAAWGTTTPHLMFPPHWQVTYHPPSFSTWKSALPGKESVNCFFMATVSMRRQVLSPNDPVLVLHPSATFHVCIYSSPTAIAVDLQLLIYTWHCCYPS
jgi:hypothetical protein